jgi:hypothetical protein
MGSGAHGPSMEPRNLLEPGADGVPETGRQDLRARQREGSWGPAGSETSRTCVGVLCGNREILWSTPGMAPGVRAGNPKGAIPR